VLTSLNKGFKSVSDSQSIAKNHTHGSFVIYGMQISRKVVSDRDCARAWPHLILTKESEINM